MQRHDRLSTRCSFGQTWVRRAGALALAAVGSLLWTAPDLGAQEPAPAATAPTDQSAAVTQRYRVSFLYDSEKELGSMIAEMSASGFEIEGLEFKKEKEAGASRVMATIATTGNWRATKEAFAKLASAKTISLLTKVESRPPKVAPAPPGAKKPAPTEAAPGALVTLEFDDTDIRELVNVIAKTAKANIILAPEVQGTLTLRMSDVPWRDALDTAVEALGYVVAERNSGILVITTKHAIAK